MFCFITIIIIFASFNYPKVILYVCMCGPHFCVPFVNVLIFNADDVLANWLSTGYSFTCVWQQKITIGKGIPLNFPVQQYHKDSYQGFWPSHQNTSLVMTYWHLLMTSVNIVPCLSSLSIFLEQIIIDRWSSWLSMGPSVHWIE